ncbi:peptide deformylase [Pseudoroseicyclus sp. H15]
MSLTLRLVPDPVLQAISEPVRPGAEAGELARQMLELMYVHRGRGLAAVQAGWLARLFVMDVDWPQGSPRPRIFANPRVVRESSRLQVVPESCLSIPGVSRRIARPAEIVLAWQGTDGRQRQEAFEGYEATIIQHEIDHLDGVLMTERPEVPR